MEHAILSIKCIIKNKIVTILTNHDFNHLRRGGGKYLFTRGIAKSHPVLLMTPVLSICEFNKAVPFVWHVICFCVSAQDTSFSFHASGHALIWSMSKKYDHSKHNALLMLAIVVTLEQRWAISPTPAWHLTFANTEFNHEWALIEWNCKLAYHAESTNYQPKPLPLSDWN